MKILNLNAWLMPFSLSSDNKARFSRIIDLIQEQDPDIITLQEVWTQAYVRRFRSALPQHHFTSSGRGTLQNNSGLLTITKKVPLHHKSYRFSLRQVFAFSLIDEWIAQKGMLVMGLPIEGKLIHVINTHMLSRGHPKHGRPMKYQIQMLKRIIDKHENVICIGDFNMSAREFRQKLAGFYDLHFAQSPTLASSNKYQFKRKFNYFIPREESVDHVIRKSDSLKIKIDIEVIKAEVSDHYPMLIKVNFC